MKKVLFSTEAIFHPGYGIQKFSFIEFLYEVLRVYQEGETEYQCIFPLIEASYLDEAAALRNWNTETWEYIQKKIESLGYICKIEQESTQVVLTIQISGNIFSRIQEWIEGEIKAFAPNTSLEKMLELFTYHIYSLQDNDTTEKNIISLSQKDFDILDISVGIPGEDVDIDASKERIPNFEELLLFYLFVKGVLKYIYFPADTDRMQNISGKYAVTIDNNFRYSSIVDTHTLVEELEKIDRFTKVIAIRKTRKGFILEKTREIFGLDNRVVDLIKMYPHSEISGKVYNGKINKYTIIEKIQLKSIDKHEK